jgi:5-methyltetrahydropteroyltriglutamate--homocysteine methyltransferase
MTTTTQARTVPPFRADHVGSLLRPPELHQARADFKAQKIDAQALAAVEDQAILDVIELQRSAGIRTITDGEFRRTSWHMDFIYQLQGVTQVSGESIHVQFKNAEGEYDYAPPAMRIDGRVGIDQTIFADAFEFVRDQLKPGEFAKLTDPSPSMVHYRSGMTWPPRTPSRSPASTSSAAASCSSTTPVSPTSTTRPSAPTSRRSAGIPITCTSNTSR